MDGPVADRDLTTGLRVEFRRGLRTLTGITVRADDGMALVIGPDGELRSVPEGKLRPLSSSGADVQSSAYRLWAATPQYRDIEIVRDRLRELLQPIAARRAFAQAAVQNDQPLEVSMSGLSTTEQAWLLMWLYSNDGSVDAAFEQLSSLPIGGYPDKLHVIVANWKSWDSPQRHAVLKAHVEPFETATADLLKLAMYNDHGAATRLQQRAQLGQLQMPGLRQDDDFAQLRNALAATSPDAVIGDIERAATTSAAASLRYALVANKWAAGCSPTPSSMLSWPESRIDDLIDRGLIGPELIDVAKQSERQDIGYLVARLRPASADKQQLKEYGFTEELARRAFIAGDEWRGFLPESDLARGHFELLDRFRAGDAKAASELIPALPVRLRTVAEAVARSLETGQVDAAALADHSTWPTLAQLVPRGDALRVAGPAAHRLHEWRSLHEATQALYDWDWAAAADAAREALRTASDEDTRDEALNLLACALHQQGNVEGAARALEEALQGIDSVDLIVNYGIVAAELDPRAASNELARLAIEAPTLELRVTAARRALLLWGSHIPGEDADDHPPESLVAAMRALAVAPTGADEHTGIMKFLSWADDEWLADANHTSTSEYAASAPHRYFVARAQGPSQGIEELAALHRSNPDDEFVVQESHDLGGTVRRLMVRDERALGAAVWGLALTDAELPLDPRDQVLVPVLAAREFAFNLIDEEERTATLKPELLTRVIKARRRLATLDDPGPCETLIDHTVAAIAVACFPGWFAELKTLDDAVNSVVSRVIAIPRRQIDWRAVGRIVAPLSKAIDDQERYMRSVRKALNDDDLASELDELLALTASLDRRLRMHAYPK